MGGAGEGAPAQSERPNWVELMPDVVKYTLEGLANRLESTFVPVMGRLVGDNGKYWFPETASPSTSGTFAAKSGFRTTPQICCQSARKHLRHATAFSLRRKRRLDIHTIQDNIQSLLSGGWTATWAARLEWLAERMPAYRAELIARTETTRLQNEGHRRWGGGV